jgi:Fungal fucose-specific lectin
MAQSARVVGFLPSSNGFHFTNSWPHEPDLSIPFPTGPINIGDASNGLCGGMAYAVRDYFEAGLPIPLEASNPALHTPLYDYIVRRLFDSFDLPAGVAAYISWQLPTRNQFKDTVQGEWPKIKAALDANQLVALGLIRTRSFSPGNLGKNHQVLTFGYDLDDSQRVTLHLYDPNHSDRDDVTLSFGVGNPNGTADIAFAVGTQVVPPTGEQFTFGCFVTKYTHVDPTGLVWPQVPRVIGLDGDGHVLEVSLPVGGTWSYGDLTVIADAPAATGAARGYVSWLDRTDRVVFRTADGHIHEVSLPSGGVWTIGDLSALSGAPDAAGDPFGYVAFFDHVPRVVYRGTDGHIHEISLPVGSGWVHGDLTTIAGADLAAGDVTAYVTDVDSTVRVVYWTTNGDIGEISLVPGHSWTYGKLTQQVGAPAAVGDPMGYVNSFDETARVLYRTAAAHIQELSLPPGGQWATGDLTAMSGATPAAGDPFGYSTVFDQTSRVLYRGTDDHVHEISLPPGRTWVTGDLTAQTGAPAASGEPRAYVSPLDHTARVVYRNAAGHVCEISLPAGRTWSFGDLTQLSGGGAEVSDPHAYIG